MHPLHENEGRKSLVFQDRIGVCHMQTNMHKKASEHRNLCAHTRNEAISTGNIVFVGSSHDACACSLLTPPHITGLGVCET